MRALFTLAFAILISVPAMAQPWGHYDNARFGYGIDIPPGFSGFGESDNGDGQSYSRIETEQTLLVWGGQLMGSFEDEATQRAAAESAENWGISDQTITPQWAHVVGMRDHRLVYQRMILLCDGASYAAFRMEYNIRDLEDVAPVLEGLSRSFVPAGC